MESSSVQIVLIPAPDEAGNEPAVFPTCGETLEWLLKELLQCEHPLLEGESLSNAVLLQLAATLGPSFGAVLGAWLHARYGRKVRIRVGEMEAEGQTVQEVGALLAKAEEIQQSVDWLAAIKHPIKLCRDLRKVQHCKAARRQSKYTQLTRISGEMTPSPPADTNDHEFLLEAYKKHSTELASIEDRLNKLLLIILGVFGVGATEIPKAHLGYVGSVAVVVIVLVFAFFGWHYSSELRGVRAEVRYLLVRCEIAMGFYIRKNPTQSDSQLLLYTHDELEYPRKGGFLSSTSAAAIFVAAFGLIILIFAAMQHHC
jgi:hypothetical protein